MSTPESSSLKSSMTSSSSSSSSSSSLPSLQSSFTLFLTCLLLLRPPLLVGRVTIGSSASLSLSDSPASNLYLRANYRNNRHFIWLTSYYPLIFIFMNSKTIHQCKTTKYANVYRYILTINHTYRS